MSTKLYFKRVLCAFALLATSAVSVLGQSVTNTPWDVVINGNYTGTAQLYFFDDFTLAGVQLVTSATKGKSAPDIDRGGSDTGRLPGDSDSTNGPTTIKRLYGSTILNGNWTTDSRGKILGTYSHGPALARNPAIADLLLRWAIGADTLAPVDDTWADRLRAERLAAAGT